MTESESSSRSSASIRILQYAYCFLPLAALCVVYLIYAQVYNSVIVCPNDPKGCTPIPEIREALRGLLPSEASLCQGLQLSVFAGRISWATSIGLSLLFSLVVFLWGGYLAAQMRRYDKRSFWHNLWLPLAAIIVWFVLRNLTSDQGSAGAPWRQFGHGCLTEDFAEALTWTRSLDNAAFFLAAYVALVLSAYFCASVNHRTRWRRDFNRHATMMHVTLYAGALLLVAGVFRIWALLYWSLDYVEPLLAQGTEEQRLLIMSMQRIADGVISSRGLLYSMMLAAIYLPSVLLLRHQVRAAVADGELDAEGEESWTQGFSLSDNLLRLVAILGPAISGPAAEYLELFH